MWNRTLVVIQLSDTTSSAFLAVLDGAMTVVLLLRLDLTVHALLVYLTVTTTFPTAWPFASSSYAAADCSME